MVNKYRNRLIGETRLVLTAGGLSGLLMDSPGFVRYL